MAHLLTLPECNKFYKNSNPFEAMQQVAVMARRCLSEMPTGSTQFTHFGYRSVPIEEKTTLGLFHLLNHSFKGL